MLKLEFSLDDYQNGLMAKIYSPPENFLPLFRFDPIAFHQLESSNHRRGKLIDAVSELRKRTGKTYFRKIYSLQARTLGYSGRAFPAYKHLLPEIMTEDWLSMVDWGKYQRDHVLHQPLCGYVMLKLLDNNGTAKSIKYPNGKTLLDTCVDNVLDWNGTAYLKDFLIKSGMSPNNDLLNKSNPIARNLWALLIRETAYIAAIFHDLGYPWQYTQRLAINLQDINSPTLRHQNNIPQLVDLFEKRLLFRALNGYPISNQHIPSTWQGRLSELVSTTIAKTHGFPGALCFLHLNDFVREFPSDKIMPLNVLCIEWAAMAIMMHDMGKIYWGNGEEIGHTPENPFLRLSFEKDPISILVTLVDIIQDFERPAVTFDSRSGVPVKISYNTACMKTKMEINHDGFLRLSYRMMNNNHRAIKRKLIPKEQHSNFDPDYGYLDLRGLGINRVEMVAI